MRVKCLAQEHNTMSPARARTWTARSGVERTNHEATVPPITGTSVIICSGILSQSIFSGPLPQSYIFRYINSVIICSGILSQSIFSGTLPQSYIFRYITSVIICSGILCQSIFLGTLPQSYIFRYINSVIICSGILSQSIFQGHCLSHIFSGTLTQS